ncbi:N-acetylglucosamine/diacetylchitobiose ABC transporter substrate-binding protein [Microlunatus parietis]|uniref:N-acetylglucosamine transport system substrate-binding protein n=1 Tax=Microlunatus parietis TaxID=682979 RepID=A0A7Y9LFV0_9ACTN|nr:N-acetylglucosamine/diacetylchitobiose ABC transporter substrate-binding protein [Microlunatus parietis]NYE75360.1 N-acetylglucosamine transport system substrate-binding protein [Microlunatus parietis]
MAPEFDKQVPPITRRSLIKTAAAGAALAGTGGLTACVASGGAPDPGASSSAGEQTADNPLGVDKKAPLEVVIFNGGYGDQYGKEHVALYNTWAGGEVGKMSSTVKIASTLQSRFAGGNPPEVIDNSGADAMPTATLVADNQLADLTPLLDAPSVDDPNTKIRDLLMPAAIVSGSYDGVMRQLPYVFAMWGFWYSGPLFAEKGWEPAKTWDDFLGLCDKIKSTGLAPFVHTGVHTQYMDTILDTMAIKHGGIDIMLNIDNLRPNAFDNESVLAAAKAVRQLHDEGYIMEGSEGLDHTTSQAQWLQGRAAIIPCGSWLENEMRKQIKPGFDMVAQPVPSLTASDQLPFEALYGGPGENFIVAENAKNKLGGMQYLRLMLSNDAGAKFAELTGSLIATKTAPENLTNPTTALKSVAEATKAAGENIFSLNFNTWYAPMNDARKREMANLINGRSTPDQYVAAMQKAADEVAQDPKIKKFTREA